MNIGDFGEVADDVAILEQGHEGVAVADIAVDEMGAIVIAGPAVEIEDAMAAVEKVADDESSDPPTAAGDCYAERFWHLPEQRLAFIRLKCARENEMRITRCSVTIDFGEFITFI
jgi:hypothetical protein